MLPNVFGFQDSSPLSFPDSLPFSLTLTLHFSLSLSLPPSFAEKACCWCTETHVIEKCISSAKHAFWNPLYLCKWFLNFTNVFLSVFFLFIFAHLFPSLCSSVTLSCRIPEDSEPRLFLVFLFLRWRDVVTMECSIVCQRRHSGWTEWSNRRMQRREEKRREEMRREEKDKKW